MRETRGMTLVEVLVALGLFALLGGASVVLLSRSEAGRQASEAVQAATTLLASLVEAMTRQAPSWLPGPGGTVTLTGEQIGPYLQGMSTSYTDPSLYQVRVTRSPSPDAQGLDRYTFEVCVRPGGQRLCYTQDLAYASVSAAHLQPPSREGEGYTPPRGTARLDLVIQGDSPGAAQVTLSGPDGFSRTYTTYGTHSYTLVPGTVTLAAQEARDGRYSYRPTPSGTRDLALRAGEARSLTVEYRCQTGAAAITVVPPEGGPLPSGTVTLAGVDVSQGGTLPYLPPGGYTLQAQDVRRGDYTYSPSYSPSANLSLSPCQTTGATVAYRPVTGSLTVEITTPAGLTPRVRVAGPGLPQGRTLTGTTTLPDLVPGTYTVTPEDVLRDGSRYQGTANPANPQVTAGQNTASRVVYAAVSGRVRVTVNPPPGGGPRPQAVLSGPGGWSANLGYGTSTFDDRAPGQYTLSAQTISDDLYTYAPSPGTSGGELAPGETLALSTAYAPATGAVQVRVDGLPDPSYASRVSLDGTPLPANPHTFPYQAPGSHQVEAATFSHGGYLYAPDAARRTVAVQAGALTDVLVVYTRLQGTVEIRVGGLPDPSRASWTLTGPTGTRSGTGPRILTGMPTGTYTLSASPVDLGGIRYEPTVAPSGGTLAHGGSLAFTISYTPVTGNLRLELTGLPSGQGGNVSVTGPGGYSATVTASTTLTGLLPGSYAVSAGPVARGEPTPYGTLTYTYAPSPRGTTATVTAGNTASVTVAYVRQQGDLSLSVSGLPSGASTNITLSGAGGFSRTERASGPSASFSYPGLPTGDYRATGADVSWNGFTYKASPVGGTLAHGGRLTLTLAYAPGDGKLRATATGLPQGAPAPTITVKDTAGNTVHQANAYDLRLQALAPGNYSVSFSPVSVGDYTWTPTPATATVTVSAGQEATVTATYAEDAAYIRISATGATLPQGTAASGEVRSGNRTVSYTVAIGGSVLVKVPLGLHTVVPFPLAVGGYTYRPNPATTDVNVTVRGSVYPVSLEYVEDSGRVVLSVSGLPSSAQGTLTLSGPVTRSQTCGNGTCTFSRLPLGSYTLSAGDYRSPSYTYRATLSPSAFTLSASGQTLSGRVTYAPVDGALSFTVTGPAGMPSPKVDLYRGTVLVRSFTGTGTFTVPYLPPGSYRLVPDRVSTGSGYYSAAPVDVSITAGTTATATVTYTYTATKGTLNLTVSGLPAGVVANIALTGPGLNRTLSLGNGSYSYSLDPGGYTLTPGRVTTLSANYVAPGSTFTLTAGSTVSASVAYTVERGRLTLTVSGLPAGATASISLSRQGGGYTNTLSLANGSYAYDLPTGTYGITAMDVTTNSGVYTPNPVSASVNLTSSGAAQTFTYSRSAGSLTIVLNNTGGHTINVRITGPGGYSTTVAVSGSRQLTGLNPGSYTVQPSGFLASVFPDGAVVACPYPGSLSANVPSGGNFTASFTYSYSWWQWDWWQWGQPCPMF